MPTDKKLSEQFVDFIDLTDTDLQEVEVMTFTGVSGAACFVGTTGEHHHHHRGCGGGFCSCIGYVGCGGCGGCANCVGGSTFLVEGECGGCSCAGPSIYAYGNTGCCC